MGGGGARGQPISITNVSVRRDLVAHPGGGAELDGELVLPPARPGQVVVDEAAWAQIMEMIAASRAPSTARNYAADTRRFRAWCEAHGYEMLPAAPEVVAAYLNDQAAVRDGTGDPRYSPATLTRWLSAINFAHRARGLPLPGEHPIVAFTLAGIRRTYARTNTRPTRRRDPLRTADIDKIVTAARAGATTWVAQVRERRDTALLWLGMVGAFRRSELAGLAFTDVRGHTADGLHIRLRYSKTDQYGSGQVKVIPYGEDHLRCPVCAYHRWHEVVCAADAGGRGAVIGLLHRAAPWSGHVCREVRTTPPVGSMPVFRQVSKAGLTSAAGLSGASVHAIVRRRAAAAGYPPEQVELLGGHSLRAGFVTEALSNGASAHNIMRQTGHRSANTVEIYAREHAPIENNAATQLGL